MDDSVRNIIIGSIVLVLASMYGGDSLGSWFTFEVEGDSPPNPYSFKTSANFMLTEYEIEIEGSNGSFDEKSDYDDSDAVFCDTDCDELNDLMIGKIQKLLYVVILAGFAALYFLNEGDREKGAMACLAMGGAGLLAVGMFALYFPEALDDDQNSFGEMGEDPSLFGDESFDEAGQFEGDAKWRPGIAFALVGLSGILGMAAYSAVKNQNNL